MATVRDVVARRPRILFVGINPSLRSGEIGHHFAGRGNPFWRLLHRAGLVPEELLPEEDQRLAEFGLALTNLCPRPTRSASELNRREIERGRRSALRKIRSLRPRVVAFVGITLYREFFPKGSKGGPGPKAETIEGARVFALPNPSGLNATFPGFRDKLVWFERLRDFAGQEAPDRLLHRQASRGMPGAKRRP